MDQLRTTKVSRLIQKELGEILRLETQKRHSGEMISVTEVRLSPDLSSARVFLSYFPDAKKEELRAYIKENSAAIRGEMGRRMSSQLRRIPELIFTEDNSLEEARRIDELLGHTPGARSED